MRENAELKAKVASLENALNGATSDLPADLCSCQSAQYDLRLQRCTVLSQLAHVAESDIRVWRAMLHAAEMHSKSEVTVAENLRSLIAGASAQVEANHYQEQLEAQAYLHAEPGIFWDFNLITYTCSCLAVDTDTFVMREAILAAKRV